MNRNLTYLLVVAIIIIVINVYFNISIYHKQLAFQRNMMFGQVEKTTTDIEAELVKFEDDVNSILFSSVIDNIDIKNDDSGQEGLKILEILFTKYISLIKNISIYDSHNNMLNLSFNTTDVLLIDSYITQKQNVLRLTENVVKSDNYFEYTLPVFRDHEVYANIVFTLDMQNYFQYIFNKYKYDNTFWQWVVNADGKVEFNNLSENITYARINEITSNINQEVSDFLIHDASIGNKNEKLVSVYYPLNIFKQRFGVIFSMRSSIIHDLIIRRVVISGSLSFAVVLLYVIMLMGKLGKSNKQKVKANSELLRYKLIFNNLPVGILVMDQVGHTRIMNQAAKDLLLIKSDEEFYGKNLTERFMLSRDYYDKSPTESAYDSDQFVVYRREGEEVSVYKKELPFTLNDEDLTLSAFIDISHIEKSRKYEAAANTAKSEFLAKMSHEIRTPMNGIIGMTEALNRQNLTAEQKDYIEIVKKSADLLLNLIDDILDFSKIEAGKMQIEEIPFNLREEVNLSLDLFRPIIEDKNLKFTLKISPDIPDNIISDPFRLRQILSNLISNAVKFTHEGEIAVGIELTEQYNHNLTLLFYVEDTGVGIQRDQIETIFNSFTQAEESTSRKYGGSGLGTTIVKQLINLMNGEIWVESPSQISKKPEYPGSKFSFTIEAYSNEKLKKDFNFDTIQTSHDIKTLLILQNPQTKQRLIRLLQHEKLNYEIFDFQDKKYDDLKNKLNSKSDIAHVLIIIDEKGLNGMHIARNLDQDNLTKNHLMIMISANHRHDNYIQSKRFGVDHYLLEPFESIDIMQCIFDEFPNVKRIPGELIRKIRPDLSILVAEDNDINIKVAETIFSNLGFSIDLAHNGVEVAEKIKTKPYDIIFMDLIMPEMDGVQATVEIRGSGYQMPIVAMTATASSKTKSKAIASGMNDYIVKPVKTDTIRNILLKWFA